MLCADRMVSPDKGEVTKIGRNPNGDIAAISGTLSVAQRWMRAFIRGDEELPPLASVTGSRDDACEAIVVRKATGVVESWDNDGYCVFDAPYYSGGSGWKFAAAAMEAGASAKRAVEIASKFDSSTGLGVDILKL